VNDEQIKRKRLEHNDLIRIGFVYFKFFDEAKEQELAKTNKIKKSWIPGVFYTK
jgi:phosphatidylglycerophosphatase A